MRHSGVCHPLDASAYPLVRTYACHEVFLICLHLGAYTCLILKRGAFVGGAVCGVRRLYLCLQSFGSALDSFFCYTFDNDMGRASCCALGCSWQRPWQDPKSALESIIGSALGSALESALGRALESVFVSALGSVLESALGSAL